MKRHNKYLMGWLIWFSFGLFSMTLGWTHFITWTIGTYLYISFVEPFATDKVKRKQKR